MNPAEAVEEGTSETNPDDQRASSAALSTEAIRAAFTGSIELPRVSFLYQAGLAVVAFAMVLLPAVYIGLIGLAGYTVYYHATHNLDLLSGHGAAIARLLIYFGPIVIGAILVFFMVKPFFARSTRQSEYFSISHADQPELFAFIGRICQLVNAPLPSRVDVDCEVNASASFRQGLASLFGNDVKLTIGLPLVAGMTAQQFAGVLAHEFGHFAQGAGMRLTYVVRSLNAWFARVVYERDSWDHQLEAWASEADFRISIVLHLARFCIWLTRRVLWVLMVAGHGISCFMLRQMEYDADFYEVKLAGSRAFVETMERLQNMSVASQTAYQDIRESWNSKRLPDNIPALIQHKAQTLSEDLKQKLAAAKQERKTGFFDTHPSASDRELKAKVRNEPGVFALAEPATGLFRNFSALARETTRFHYLHNLELTIGDQNLVDYEQMVSESNRSAAEAAAIKNYFCGLSPMLKPVVVSGAPRLPSEDNSALKARLQSSRQRLEESREEIGETCAKLTKSHSRMLELSNAFQLLQAGFTFKAEAFELNEATPLAVQEAKTQAKYDKARAQEQFEVFHGEAQTRLLSAMQLLRDDTVALRIEGGEKLRQEVETLIPILTCMGEVWGALDQIAEKHNMFRLLLQNRQHSNDVVKVDRQLTNLTTELWDLINSNLTRLQRVPYPFEHARGAIMLNDYARHEGGHEHEWEAVFFESSTHLERLYTLYQRALGRLTVIAAFVETSELSEPSVT